MPEVDSQQFPLATSLQVLLMQKGASPLGQSLSVAHSTQLLNKQMGSPSVVQSLSPVQPQLLEGVQTGFSGVVHSSSTVQPTQVLVTVSQTGEKEEVQSSLTRHPTHFPLLASQVGLLNEVQSRLLVQGATHLLVSTSQMFLSPSVQSLSARQVPGQSPQPNSTTLPAQIESQVLLQQKLSWAHTQASIAGSLQPGPNPDAQQEFSPVDPPAPLEPLEPLEPPPPPQVPQPNSSTWSTHTESHSNSQQ